MFVMAFVNFQESGEKAKKRLDSGIFRNFTNGFTNVPIPKMGKKRLWIIEIFLSGEDTNASGLWQPSDTILQ